mgnify:CR=1 FL=1
MSEVINKVATDATLTTQEQNWEIFSAYGDETPEEEKQKRRSKD